MKNRPIAADWGCAELHRERSPAQPDEQLPLVDAPRRRERVLARCAGAGAGAGAAGSAFGKDITHDLPKRFLATTVDGELSLDDADLTAPTAWLFGAEAHGLSGQLAERADNRVTIPMSGSAQSLNVAAAAAICLYQSARAQRAGSGD